MTAGVAAAAAAPAPWLVPVRGSTMDVPALLARIRANGLAVEDLSYQAGSHFIRAFGQIGPVAVDFLVDVRTAHAFGTAEPAARPYGTTPGPSTRDQVCFHTRRTLARGDPATPWHDVVLDIVRPIDPRPQPQSQAKP